jgi:hypothetical protein
MDTLLTSIAFPLHRVKPRRRIYGYSHIACSVETASCLLRRRRGARQIALPPMVVIIDRILAEDGRDAVTPVRIVRWCSTSEQRARGMFCCCRVLTTG